MDVIMRTPSVSNSRRNLVRALRSSDSVSGASALSPEKHQNFSSTDILSPEESGEISYCTVPQNVPDVITEGTGSVGDLNNLQTDHGAPHNGITLPKNVEEASDTQAEYERARRDGYAAGLAAGTASARNEMAPLAQRFSDISSKIENLIPRVLEASEDAVVEAIFTGLCKILGKDYVISLEAGLIITMALRQLKVKEHVTIMMHREDLLLLEGMKQLYPELREPSLQFQVGSTIELGGCEVLTAGGQLDARLETQLSELKVALLQARELKLPDTLNL